VRSGALQLAVWLFVLTGKGRKRDTAANKGQPDPLFHVEEEND